MRELNMMEAAVILGGIDKRAQDALYTIGYIVGVIVRLETRILTQPALSMQVGSPGVPIGS